MTYIPKYFILVFLIFFSVTLTFAQVDSTFIKLPDSCSTCLGRIECINSIHSQISIISKEQLSPGYSLNILEALQGKINGADIKTSTSGNSASSVFFMRGERNLTSSNQPLFVVDGIPVIGQINSHLGFDHGNMVNDWNLDDVESVTILKGGLAASLYGNNAGHGAIVIQTKKAEHQGFHIDYNSTVLLRQISDFPDFQNKYGQGLDGKFSYTDGNGGGIYDKADCSWGPPMDGQLITQFDGPSTGWINGTQQQVRGGDIWARNQAATNGIDNSITPTPWVAQPENVKNYYQSAWTLANNLSLAWADKQGSIRLAYSNVRGEFVTPNTLYIRNTIDGNFTYTFFKKLTFFGSFQNSGSKDKNAQVTDEYNHINPMKYFASMGRQVNTHSLKRYWQAGQENIQQFQYEEKYWNNPWFIAYENSTPLKRTNVFGAYGLKFDIVKGLSLNYLGGFNRINAHAERNNHVAGHFTYSHRTDYETNTETNFRNSIYADYNFLIGSKNQFNTFGGIFFEKNKRHDIYVLYIQETKDVGAEMNTNGFYGGVTFVRNKTLTIRLTINNDKFKTSVTKYNSMFYALSAGIELRNILRLPDLVSTFQIQTGFSNTGLNKRFDLLVPQSTKPDFSPFSTVSEYNLSTDLGFFKNRFHLNANLYRTQTNTDFIADAISSQSGYPYSTVFFNSIRNSGFELSLSVVPLLSGSVEWKSELSFFRNSNQILKLPDGISSVQVIDNKVSMNNEVENPMGNLYGYRYKRFEGQIIYQDGIPQINNEYELLGNVHPDYMIFYNNSLRIGKFALSVGMEYSKGGIAYSYFYSAATYAGTLSNTVNRTNGVVGIGVKWDESSSEYVENDVLVSAEKLFSSEYFNAEYSTVDATYLKMRDINVAYSFKVRQKINLTCSIFGNNFFTWSKCKDYNNGNLYFTNNLFYRGLNNFNLPETYEIGLKLRVHI